MNITIIGISITIIIAIIGAAMACIHKSVRFFVVYLIGLIFMAGGVYLLPSTMWRMIAIVLLIIGLIVEVLAMILTSKLHTK